MRANRWVVMGLLVLALAVLLPVGARLSGRAAGGEAGCGGELELPEDGGLTVVTQRAALGSSVGDFNRDGVTDGQDDVDWIKSFGIRLRTYGVTDEIYNPGYALPRRSFDWSVKMISDDCLPLFGVGPEAYPPSKLNDLPQVMAGMRKLPVSYLRLLGKRGFTLHFTRPSGRLAKSWVNRQNNINTILMKWWPVSGCDGSGNCARFAGRMQARLPDGGYTPFENLAFRSFDGTTLVFDRPSTQATYTATVATNGALMSGSFTKTDADPGTPFAVAADFGGDGATTKVGSSGRAASCILPDGGQDEWEVGDVRNWIGLVLDNSTHNVIHEIGHFVQDDLLANSLGPFLPEDLAALSAAGFTSPTPGCSQKVWDVAGPPGYVSLYAACDNREDFGETFAYYFDDRSTLYRRASGNAMLTAKANFMAQRMDHVDPAPAVARHPTSGQLYAFDVRTRGAIYYSTGSSWLALPSGGTTKEGVAAVAFGDSIYLFSIGNDEYLYWQRIGSSGSFGGWVREGSGLRPRKGVAAAVFGTRIIVAITGNDWNFYYASFDGNGGWSQWTNAPVGPVIVRPPSLVTCGGKLHFLATDAAGTVSAAALHPMGAWDPWASLGTSQAGSAGLCVAGETTPRTFAISPDYRLLQNNGQARSWTELPGGGTTSAPPAFAPQAGGDVIFAKGLGDGALYVKPVWGGAWSKYGGNPPE